MLSYLSIIIGASIISKYRNKDLALDIVGRFIFVYGFMSFVNKIYS